MAELLDHDLWNGSSPSLSRKSRPEHAGKQKVVNGEACRSAWNVVSEKFGVIVKGKNADGVIQPPARPISSKEAFRLKRFSGSSPSPNMPMASRSTRTRPSTPAIISNSTAS